MRSFRSYLGIGISVLAFFSVIFFGRMGVSMLLDLRASSYDATIRAIKAENSFLRSGLSDIDIGDDVLGIEGVEYVTVGVYASYPFSDSETILIDYGSRDGAKKGMSVLTKNGVLVGKLETVMSNRSEVITIYDEKWASEVEVGEKQSVAVALGGVRPRLEYILSDIDFTTDDSIRSISTDFPFGIIVGTVYKNEYIRPAFEIKDLREVIVITEL
jgi:hypothetical protein